MVIYDKPYFSGKSRTITTNMRDFMARKDRQQTTFMYTVGSLKVMGGMWVLFTFPEAWPQPPPLMSSFSRFTLCEDCWGVSSVNRLNCRPIRYRSAHYTATANVSALTQVRSSASASKAFNCVRLYHCFSCAICWPMEVLRLCHTAIPNFEVNKYVIKKQNC